MGQTCGGPFQADKIRYHIRDHHIRVRVRDSPSDRQQWGVFFFRSKQAVASHSKDQRGKEKRGLQRFRHRQNRRLSSLYVIGKFRLLLFFRQSTIPIIIILGIVRNGGEIRCVRWKYWGTAEVTYYLYWGSGGLQSSYTTYCTILPPSPPSALPISQRERRKEKESD